MPDDANASPEPYETNQPAPPRRRILWLHTQPEHYFNCMLDDLQGNTPYTVPAWSSPEPGESFDWIAAFQTRGHAAYTDYPQPRLARTVFLTLKKGREKEALTMRGRIHADWRADLLPLKPDAVIVSGYGTPTV